LQGKWQLEKLKHIPSVLNINHFMPSHISPHPSEHMLRHSYTPQTTDDHMNWKVPWELATPIIPGYQASKRAGILHNQSCRQLSVELLNEYFSSH